MEILILFMFVFCMIAIWSDDGDKEDKEETEKLDDNEKSETNDDEELKFSFLDVIIFIFGASLILSLSFMFLTSLDPLSRSNEREEAVIYFKANNENTANYGLFRNWLNWFQLSSDSARYESFEASFDEANTGLAVIKLMQKQPDFKSEVLDLYEAKTGYLKLKSNYEDALDKVELIKLSIQQCSQNCDELTEVDLPNAQNQLDFLQKKIDQIPEEKEIQNVDNNKK
jgi:CRISPR/Cas system CMR subunit Cmr4 (Cas7 group RAMP superfamily)